MPFTTAVGLSRGLAHQSPAHSPQRHDGHLHLLHMYREGTLDSMKGQAQEPLTPWRPQRSPRGLVRATRNGGGRGGPVPGEQVQVPLAEQTCSLLVHSTHDGWECSRAPERQARRGRAA